MRPGGLTTALSAVGYDAARPYRQVFTGAHSLQIEMLAGARRSGGGDGDSRHAGGGDAQTAAGSPVVVLQNLGLSWAPSWRTRW